MDKQSDPHGPESILHKSRPPMQTSGQHVNSTARSSTYIPQAHLMRIIICSPSPSRPYAIWRPAARVTMQIPVSLSPFADTRGEQPVHLHQDGQLLTCTVAVQCARLRQACGRHAHPTIGQPLYTCLSARTMRGGALAWERTDIHQGRCSHIARAKGVVHVECGPTPYLQATAPIRVDTSSGEQVPEKPTRASRLALPPRTHSKLV